MYIFCIILIIIILFIIFYFKKREINLLNNLNNMLDLAINGEFTEDLFDESMLSAFETRLKKYISSSVLSLDNINIEKENIKQLISDISHQTKTPISNITIYSELLNEEDLSEECKEYLKYLLQQTEKLEFLISSLIKMSRLETDIIKISPKENDVNVLFKDIKIQFIQKASIKNINIIINETNVKATFDEKWTIEALYNILDNAIKYSFENSNIEISVISYQLFCRIDIKDNGIGIEEEEQNKIFTRFYRSENVSNIEGGGIGLFLTREIIKKQNGYIKVKSKIGEGSTFSIFLPIK